MDGRTCTATFAADGTIPGTHGATCTGCVLSTDVTLINANAISGDCSAQM